MYRLVKTCHACPEQYDVFLGTERVGYLRLRWGHFAAEVKGEPIYSADVPGSGGSFADADDRKKYLDEAITAVHQHIMKTKPPVPSYDVEDGTDDS